MKKNIIKRLIIILLLPMFFTVILNYLLQLKISRDSILESSQILFAQIIKLMNENNKEAESEQENFNEMCIVRARAAAYMLKYNPDAINSQEEMDKIVSLLEIDELHVFDSNGYIYAGSVPKYFGYNFNSGEQMEFFLPMLEDKSLELCQGIEPNTSENKPMKYAAVWSENGKDIIQIGMEPERILKTLEKVQLSYIFSLLTVDSGAQVYAINIDTNEILGSTVEKFVDRDATNIGFDANKFNTENTVHTMLIDGVRSYVTFEKEDDIVFARVISSREIKNSIIRDSTFILLYLVFIAIVMFIFVLNYLDKKIIKTIFIINNKLESITSGNLDVKMDVFDTPEFNELLVHINDMMRSVLDSTDKISRVLDMVNLPIGIYEYNPSMKRVRVTSRVKKVLRLSDDEAQKIFSDDKLFAEKIEQIRKNLCVNGKNIYEISKDDNYFVLIEGFEYKNSTMGVVMDVSQDIAQRRSIEQERDEDLLTGLLNRRAFNNRVEMLLERESELKNAAVVMIDSDSLKYVNDNYGHMVGDKYLKSISQILNQNSARNKVTARIGGDEFSIFIYGCETFEELGKYIDEIFSGTDKTIIKLDDDDEIILKYSTGYAVYGKDGVTINELLNLADERMYNDKKRRKGKK